MFDLSHLIDVFGCFLKTLEFISQNRNWFIFGFFGYFLTCSFHCRLSLSICFYIDLFWCCFAFIFSKILNEWSIIHAFILFFVPPILPKTILNILWGSDISVDICLDFLHYFSDVGLFVRVYLVFIDRFHMGFQKDKLFFGLNRLSEIGVNAHILQILLELWA